MKLAVTVLLGVFGVFLICLVIFGIVLNYKYDQKLEAPQFASGQFPDPVPNGAFLGNSFTGLGEKWLGKEFFADKNEGINNFKGANGTEQRYPFKTSKQKGLRNKSEDVLLLDYNYKNNPLWLKFIRDEIVQVGPGRYLGKIHVKLGPFVVTLGYFKLTQQQQTAISDVNPG